MAVMVYVPMVNKVQYLFERLKHVILLAPPVPFWLILYLNWSSAFFRQTRDLRLKRIADATCESHSNKAWLGMISSMTET